MTCTSEANYYSDFSAWDTYRSLHPLLLVVAPSVSKDMVKSLVTAGTQNDGLLPGPGWPATGGTASSRSTTR